MQREEAVTRLKEITSVCENLSPHAITLTSSKPADAISTGYQVRIKTELDEESKRQIQAIADKYNLTFTEENGEIIIYRPKN
jgi:hypothetical protein